MSDLETKKQELEIIKSTTFNEETINIMRKAILGDADAKAILQTTQDAIDAKQKEIKDLEG
jgi:hypothetical protein